LLLQAGMSVSKVVGYWLNVCGNRNILFRCASSGALYSGCKSFLPSKSHIFREACERGGCLFWKHAQDFNLIDLRENVCILVWSSLPLKTLIYFALLKLCHVKWVLCHHGKKSPRVADGGHCLHIWRVAANLFNEQSRRADKGWSPSFGVYPGDSSFSP
jgi:hypothetical protein